MAFPLASIIGAGAGLVQGIIGSRAAKKAAAIQAAAAEEAARRAREAGDTAAADVTTAGANAATDVRGAAYNAATDVRAAGSEAGRGARLSADEANELLRSIYGDAYGELTPYREAGGAAVSKLGGLADERFDAAAFRDDPGYQFRLAEGQKALERSAAMRGGLQSSGTLKALAQYSQGVASDEYGKAFERFQADRNSRAAILSNLTSVGQRAAEGTIAAGENYGNRGAANITNAAEFAANANLQAANTAGNFRVQGEDAAGRYRLGSVTTAGQFRTQGVREGNAYTTDAAAARAGGTVGSANAWSNAVGTIGGIALNTLPQIVGRRRSVDSGI